MTIMVPVTMTNWADIIGEEMAKQLEIDHITFDEYDQIELR